MKRNLFASILAGVAVGIAIFVNASKPSLAQTTNESYRFFCGTFEERPATMVRISGRDSPLIIWTRDYYFESQEDPLTRCQRVSGMFENYRKNRILNYLKAEMRKGEYVVCMTGSELEQCSRLLYQLEPNENPQEEIKKLNERLRSIEEGSYNELQCDDNNNSCYR